MSDFNKNAIEMLNVYQRIRNIMLEVKYVQKESKKVNGEYTFVSHDSVAAALHEPLARHGVIILTDVVSYALVGNRTTINIKVSFINVDSPTDRFEINSWGIGIDPSDKGYGKAMSYAVKYALLKTFCLETGDDVEKDNIPYEPPKITEKQASEIELKLNGNQKLRTDMMKWLNVSSIYDIKADMYDKVIDILNKKQGSK